MPIFVFGLIYYAQKEHTKVNFQLKKTQTTVAIKLDGMHRISIILNRTESKSRSIYKLFRNSFIKSYQQNYICTTTKTPNDVKRPPKMPEEWECCGNGCDDCVWEEYFKKQAEYREWKNEQPAVLSTGSNSSTTLSTKNVTKS